MSNRIVTCRKSPKELFQDSKCIKELSRLIQARSPPSPTSVASAGREFRGESELVARANELTYDFLERVINKTLCFMEHCRRLRIYPGDVAMALEKFAEFDERANQQTSNSTEGSYSREQAADEDDDESWAGEDDNSEMDDDDEIEDDDEDVDEDEFLEDDGGTPVIDRNMRNNPPTPTFDALFEPLGEIHMSDNVFRKRILEPFLYSQTSWCPIKTPAYGILKRAMFAYLVSKLA